MFFGPTAHPRVGLKEHIDSPWPYMNLLILVYGAGERGGEAKAQADDIIVTSEITNSSMNKPR
jgi:hypothetical protein